jgi:hypothetical protein
MRESLSRASRASSLRELVEIMEGQPDGPSMDDAFTMIYENFFPEEVAYPLGRPRGCQSPIGPSLGIRPAPPCGAPRTCGWVVPSIPCRI